MGPFSFQLENPLPLNSLLHCSVLQGTHHHHHRLEMEMTACVCGHKPPWRLDAFSHWKPRSHKYRGEVSMVIKRSPKRLKYTDNTRFNKDAGLVYIEADPSGSDSWKLEPVVNLFKQGAVGVIPTDTLSVLSIFFALIISSFNFHNVSFSFLVL